MMQNTIIILLSFIAILIKADTVTNLVAVPESSNDVALTASGPFYLAGGNGDVNNDGKLSSLDIAILNRWLLYGTNLDAAAYARADVNGDGLVNTKDQDLMRQVILGVLPREMMSGHGKWLLSRQTRTKVPATSTSEGEIGQTAVDTNFVYFCVSSNLWKRVPLNDW